MKSGPPGANTSTVEVTNISKYGLWMLVGDEELYLPFKEFPWFQKSPVSSILDVVLHGSEHLFWPELDIDLTLDSIRHPENYPLVSRDE